MQNFSINIHLELAYSFLSFIDARNDGSHFCQKLESRGIAVVTFLVVASQKNRMPTNLTLYCTEITQKPAASIFNMRRQKGSANDVESSHTNIRANYSSYERLGFKPAENKKVYMIFNDWHVTMAYHELFRNRRNCSPTGHNNTKHFLCPFRSPRPLEFLEIVR